MTSADRPRAAALFDIDGTLVDSNFLHVEAWSHAFADLGIAVDDWRIHRAIGMDSAKLLETLAPGAAEDVGDDLKDRHSRHYKRLADRLRPLPGAADLLRAVAARAVSVVLATSAPEDELEILLGVLDAEEAIAATTSSEDVGTAKPEPDIVAVALERGGAEPGTAVFIGDAVWDFVAAKKLGLPCIGLRSGGTSAEELRQAGADAVYDDPADLLARLDESPLARLWS